MREQLPKYLAQAVPDNVDLWPQIERRLPRRRRSGLWTQLASAAAGVALVVGAGVVWSHAPRTPVSAPAILEKARAALPERLDSLVGHTTMVWSDETGKHTTQWDRWYEAPNRSRTEISKDGKLESVSVHDGATMWEYRPQEHSLLIYPVSLITETPVDLSRSLRTDDVADLLKSAGECYTPRVAGVEKVGARSAYVVALGAPRCAERIAADPVTLWIDRSTYQVLKKSLAGEELQFNPPIAAERFETAPPEGTRVTDMRPGGDVMTARLVAQLMEAGRPIGFPLFFVQNPPEGMTPSEPEWTPAGFELFYTGAGKTVQIIQRKAVSADVVRVMPDLELVDVGGRSWQVRRKQSWESGTVAGGISLVRDGTYISLSSYDLTTDELIQMAESLRMVPQDRPRNAANPRPLTLGELRAKVGFPVFVPAIAPAGMTQGLPYGGDGFDIGVHVPYWNGNQEALLVTNGPERCCLDADPRKAGTEVLIHRGSVAAGGITAHFLSVEEGGPILWWNEDGAYVALSGPNQSRESLVRLAESLSDTAE